MSNVINFPRLSEEKIVKAALERLEKEKKDFYSYKGTVTFDKILGIYKQALKKGEKPQSTEERTELKEEHPDYSFNSNLGTNGQFIADGVIEDTYNALVNFVKADSYFAATVLKSQGSFTGAIAFAIHKFANGNEKSQRFYKLSDYEVFKGAVNFYFKDADVRFEMKIIKPEGFEEIEVTASDLNENPDYTAALEEAQAEKIAKEKAEEIKKKKAAERAEKKKKAEARKKAKEEEAKMIAKLKKAQLRLFGETEPTPKPKSEQKAIKVKPTKPQKKEETEPTGEQLSLFM